MWERVLAAEPPYAAIQAQTHYTIYGLTLSSELALPELCPGPAYPEADLCVSFGAVGCRPPPGDHREGYVWQAGGVAYMYVERVGAFAIRAGREITIDPAPGVEDRVLRLFLLGGALGLLLNQRAMLTLHASAVSIGGGAALFLGPGGEGKSTLAAALHARGHALIADDVAAIDLRYAVPLVLPGYPQFKLWPQAALALNEQVEALPLLHPDLEKRARQAVRGFPDRPLPLRRIYVLGGGRRRQTVPLALQAAFGELLRHSYAAALLGPAGTTAWHLRQCAQIAARVPVLRLERRRELRSLAALAAFVEADLARAGRE